jgi:transposase-like protein
MRNRLSAAEWAELVAAWEKSGEAAKAFAAEHGVAESNLRWWKTEFARRSRKAPPLPPKRPRRPRPVPMARVVRDGEPLADEERRETAAIAIVVGDARIVVEAGFDATLLRAVIHALGMPE